MTGFGGSRPALALARALPLVLALAACAPAPPIRKPAARLEVPVDPSGDAGANAAGDAAADAAPSLTDADIARLDAPALVALLGHHDARVRGLAADALSGVPLDDGLAERALAAIAAERATSLASRMGELAVAIASAHPALAPKVDALARSHPLDDLRRAVVWGVTREACCGGDQLKLGPACVGGWVRDRDAAVRAWASEAAGTCLSAGTQGKALTPTQCGDLFAFLDVPIADLATRAASRIVDGCPAVRGRLLGRVQARAATPWRGGALIAFCAIPSTTSAAERLQAVTIAVRFARDRSYDVEARGAALTAVGVCAVNMGSDPAGYGKLYLRLQQELEPAVIEQQGHFGIDNRPRHERP